MDIRMDENTGDAVFINAPLEYGDYVTEEQIVSDYKDSARQSVSIRLRSLYKDWFLDLNYGVPYLEEVLANKSASKEYIDDILKREILKDEKVEGIIDWNSTKDNSKREYYVSFKLKVGGGYTSPVEALL